MFGSVGCSALGPFGVFGFFFDDPFSTSELFLLRLGFGASSNNSDISLSESSAPALPLAFTTLLGGSPVSMSSVASAIGAGETALASMISVAGFSRFFSKSLSDNESLSAPFFRRRFALGPRVSPSVLRLAFFRDNLGLGFLGGEICDDEGSAWAS